MPSLSTFFKAALAATFAVQALAAPAPKVTVVPQPGDFHVTNNNTVNGTALHNPVKAVAQNAPPAPLPLTLTNNIGGELYAYLTGTDGDGASFFLQKDGTPYYPANPAAGIPPTEITADIAIPLSTSKGGQVTVSLTNFVSSGRIYFSIGKMTFAVNNGPQGAVIVAPSFTNPSDPNADVDYGFVEFTWDPTYGIYSNLSYVDFVGIPIAQVMQTASGNTCTVKGLPGNAIDSICSALDAQGAKDGQPWGSSCQTDTSGKNLRVLAPLHVGEIPNGQGFNNYYESYVDQVWQKYASEKLTITAGDSGTYTGQVQGDALVFDSGDSFQKPSITDIWGCNSGPFANPAGSGSQAALAIVPRLCAAFVRSTLLLEGGNVNPDGVNPSQYYPTDGTPTDHYSRIVHATETDGKGYAFAYDDVNPAGTESVDGLCNAGDPTNIEFTVGGLS